MISPSRLQFRNIKINQFGVGLLCLMPVLVFAYGFSDHAYYPEHDFLDHIVTLSTLWAKESTFFSPMQSLPGILNGTVPVGALGISDLSLPH